MSLIAALLYLTPAEVGNTQQMSLAMQDTSVSQPGVASAVAALGNKEAVLKASSQQLRQGTQVSLNDRILPIAWRQWQQGKSVRTGISDTALMQTMGVELLNTSNYTQQPVQWFGLGIKSRLVMPAKLSGSYRYLDISNFAKTAGWQLQVDGTSLKISSTPARVENIQQETQLSNPGVALSPQRLVVNLDRPTPWTVSQDRTEGIITIEASADPTLLQRFTPPPVPLTPSPNTEAITEGSSIPTSPTPNPQPPSPIVQSSQKQTTIRVNVPNGWRMRVSTVANPNRLVIDVAPDALVSRDIVWAPGLRWRQQYVSVGADRFPVTWLEINRRQAGVTIKPIWSNPSSLVGMAPLVKTAPLWQASAAVNAGYFNRKQQLPLGAIRRDGRWLSSPILNRGAIAWNDKGDIKIGHLTIQESLTTSTGDRLPILSLNSGYVQAGIARYSPEWGATYTPLTDNETLVVVQKNQVANVLVGGPFGQTPFPIPADGYLLTIRGNPQVANLLTVGTVARLDSITTPADFSRYSHIVGAGPVLLQNRQIVLDGKAENFSDAFIREAAIRSVIGTTASGTLAIAAVHNRAGGAGPTLAELSQIVQQMGLVDALNLDGGSSTSLYLGGQLINRSSASAARVHNGLGIFLQPRS
ncbi:MAG TPA: phosphodiester glycosidase family protein [Candidatus Obscuribacterales bacterium]